MTMNDKVLLETTVQLWRLAHSLEYKNNINGELVGKICYTTSFVLREILRTIIKDLAYVREIAQKIQGDPTLVLADLCEFLSLGYGRYSTSAARREFLVVSAILKEFRGGELTKEKLVVFLEMTSEQWLREFFEVPATVGSRRRIEGEEFLTSLDDRPDEMLNWIRQGPIPPPPPFPVGAASFLQYRGRDIAKVELAMGTAKAIEQDKRLLKILGRMKVNGREYDFIGRLKATTRGNWALGDVLIALETPSDVAIYTTDKHFTVICRALVRERYHGYLVNRPM